MVQVVAVGMRSRMRGRRWKSERRRKRKKSVSERYARKKSESVKYVLYDH